MLGIGGWTKLLLAALGGALACQAGRAEAAGCGSVLQMEGAGAIQGAELEARRRITATPDEVVHWTALARALSAQGRHDEALVWLGRAVTRYPGDVDLATARARTLAWSGRLDEAWMALERLETAQADRDRMVFGAHLALWRKHPGEAERRFSLALARWPDDGEALCGRGLARLEAGDLPGAEADLAARCASDSSGDACAWADAVAERRSRIRLRLAPGLLIAGGGRNGWNTPAELEVRATDWLRLRASADRRTRDFGAGAISDTFVESGLQLQIGGRFSVAMAGGAAIDPRFLPHWTAQIEPSVALEGGLALSFKYWRISFANDGAHVLAPAVLWEGGGWVLDGRYFLARPDDGGTRHAGLARMGRALGESWTLWAGGGLGSGVDYLELREGGAGRFWLGLAGAALRLDWRHRLTLDYVGRVEHLGSTSLTQHALSLGYEVKL